MYTKETQQEALERLVSFYEKQGNTEKLEETKLQLEQLKPKEEPTPATKTRRKKA